MRRKVFILDHINNAVLRLAAAGTAAQSCGNPLADVPSAAKRCDIGNPLADVPSAAKRCDIGNPLADVPSAAKRRAKREICALKYLFLCWFLLVPTLVAAAPPPERPPREIFIPYEDLHVLLEQHPQRVMLSRKEFDALVEKAKKTLAGDVPQKALVVAAAYEAELRDQRAEIGGTLTIDVLEDGLYALPLDMAGVGLRRAELDGKPAALGRQDGGPLTLFVEGAGRHELRLEMVALVETTTARQKLRYRLPRPAAAQLALTVAGDVDVKSGAAVIRRRVEEDGSRTHFALLPREGDTELVLSLNSRLQRRETAVIARSVVVDEVTTAYEKIHATVSLEILYRAIDQIRFAVPQGFEITEIASPQLARWEADTSTGRANVFIVKFREPTTDPVVLSLSALRTPARLDAWQAPRLEVLDVVAQTSIVGLLVEERLKPESLSAEGLIAVDTSVLSRALPASIFTPPPGTPPLRAVAAYYAPQSRFALTAKFIKPAAELAVSTSLLWRIGEREQDLWGGFTLLPRGEKRFAFDFRLPADWTVARVTAAGEKPLPFERYPDEAQTTRIRVRVPQGMAAGEEFAANFQARRTPPDWLSAWKTQKQEFPVCRVLGVTRDEGAVAVETRDDITARPEKLEGLAPLDAADKARYGLENVAVNLAYRYEKPPYAATVVFERTPPRLSARSFSFLKLEAEGLSAHCELHYTIEESRTQRLALRLPADTPTALRIRGLDGVEIKETSFAPAAEGDMRQWNVLLAEPRRGKVRLAVDFQQPLPEMELQAYALPTIEPVGAEYASGIVAVEGSAEFETQVKTDARKVDVGELVEADYQPGRRLLGAYGFAGRPPAVNVSMDRKPAYTLASAIVEKAMLRTQLSPDGESRTQVNFRLRAKALYVELQLPKGAELWSAQIDGTPIKPQREAKRLLLGLPTTVQNTPHDLQIVYRLPTRKFGLRGTVELPAPRLFLRAERQSPAVEVPLVDLAWKLSVPNGYEVVRTGGTLTTTDLKRSAPAVLQVAGALYYLAGGVGKFGCLPAVQGGARISARRSARYASEKADYGMEPTESMVEGSESETAADAPAEAETTTAEPPPPPEEARYPLRDTLSSKKEKPQPKEDPFSADSDITFRLKLSPSKVPAYGESTPKEEERKYQLTGVRSLKIDLQEAFGDGRVMTFQSLGADPLLRVELANIGRFDALGWAVALGTILIGAMLTCRSARAKTRFVIGCLVLATVIPIVWDCTATARVCNMLFYAAALLVPYYLAAALIRWVLVCCCRFTEWLCRKPAAAATSMLLVILTAGGPAWLDAKEPRLGDSKYIVQLVEAPPPVKAPDDAIIIPYDPDDFEGLRSADKLLIPYAKYKELWNRAYPDQKLEAPKLPADFALAGAAYQTTLEGDEYLLVTGQIVIDVFSDKFVEIPLGLSGGVLAEAKLDGQPARLRLAEVPVPPQRAQQGSSTTAKSPPSMMLLTLSGKGWHKLDLAVRMKLSRVGGWRVAVGNLPAAPASALTITVPQAQSEVRLSELPDRSGYDTERPGQTIATALGPAGRFGIRWRPKVAEGRVDRSLTARSDAVLDVQEDGLRLTWRLNLDFRGTPQEEFSVTVPPIYLVEKVEGDNVRSWESVTAESGRAVRVHLLKAAKGQEQIVLRLGRAEALGAGGHPKLSAPLVTLPQAALHTGRITLRRSPLLNVRTTDRGDMTRCDVPGDLASVVGKVEAASPLGVRPFAAYRFDRNPPALGLSVAPVQPQLTAAVQTVFQLSESMRKLETRIRYSVQDRPVYRLQIALPADFRLEDLAAPGDYEYAMTSQENRRRLTLFLAGGRSGNFDVILSGTLRRRKGLQRVDVPQLNVLGAERQEGDVAVLVDADYDFDGAETTRCEPVLLDRLRGWLRPEQFSLTRVALHYRQGDYAAALKFRPRTPEVSCNTISNVRVTDRAIEEMIFLDYTIRKAGIRWVSFLLPPAMRRAKISVPLLRQKTITPVADRPDAPLRVTIELQDKILNQLRVLVENDRQLTDKPQSAPIPVVENVDVNRQYVTLESAGRDALVVDELDGLTKLQPGQAEWKTLRKTLPRQMTHAYLVRGPADSAALTYRTQVRAAVQVVSAWIGLVETLLVLDDNGAYRAQQTYHLRNATEQYLEIELPMGAELWTAWVAGTPVKPVKAAVNDPRGVRIPLVKSAEGDVPYLVVLRYGGQMDAPNNLRQADFPLARSVNIRPELSQVRLYLPEDRRWFHFGGTMRQVKDDAELTAGYVQFQTKVAEDLRQNVLQGNPFARQRAAINYKVQQAVMEKVRQQVQTQAGNASVNEALVSNDAVMSLTRKDIERLEKAPVATTTASNKRLIRKSYEGQTINLSGAALSKLGANFSGPTTPPQGAKRGVEFNNEWLANNALVNVPPAALAPALTPKPSAGARGQQGQLGIGYHAGKKVQALYLHAPQPSAAQVAQGTVKKELSDYYVKQKAEQKQVLDKERVLVERYRNLLADQKADRFGGDKLDARIRGRTEAGWRAERTAGDRVSLLDAGSLQTSLALATPPPQGPTGEGAVDLPATGLVSLDFALPTRGRVYHFTTPLGETKITARSLAVDLIDRSIYLGVTLGAIAVLIVLVRSARAGRWDWLTNPMATTWMILLGVLSLFTGAFPVAGFLLLLAGIALKIRRRVVPTSPPAASAA